MQKNIGCIRENTVGFWKYEGDLFKNVKVVKGFFDGLIYKMSAPCVYVFGFKDNVEGLGENEGLGRDCGCTPC